MAWSLRKEVLKASIPITKLVGKAHAPFSHKKVNAKHYRNMKSQLQLGDVLLTRIRGEVSNLFIPSHLTHGALYIGDDLVLEAKGNGVVETDLIDFCLTKDEIEVVRFWLPIADIQNFRQKALSLLGTPYDYLFETDFRKMLIKQGQVKGSPSFYCTEFVCAAYFMYFGFYFNFEPRNRMGDFTYLPDDFLAATRQWQRVYSAPLNQTFKPTLTVA